jgi:hypothetical protein
VTRALPGLAATLLAIVALATAPAARADGPELEPLARFPTATLTVDSPSARTERFTVWIAATEPRREQGLMFVKALPAGRGMLFLFDRPQITGFWMKNTLIPLDLLFIAADGRVIRIAENAKPLSLATIDSMGVVLGVLEIAGGSSRRLGLAPGDYVRYPAFGKRD